MYVSKDNDSGDGKVLLNKLKKYENKIAKCYDRSKLYTYEKKYKYYSNKTQKGGDKLMTDENMKNMMKLILIMNDRIAKLEEVINNGKEKDNTNNNNADNNKVGENNADGNGENNSANAKSGTNAPQRTSTPITTSTRTQISTSTRTPITTKTQISTSTRTPTRTPTSTKLTNPVNPNPPGAIPSSNKK